VTTHPAATAFEKVLSYAGASLHRDNVDERYVTEARNGTATYTGSVTKRPGLIDKVSDCEGYTEANFPTGSRDANFDADKDGIADAWEQANGGDLTAKGYDLDPAKYYTNIEVYANSLVQHIMTSGNDGATTAALEYYPAYKREDGTVVPAINTLGLDLSGGTNAVTDVRQTASGTPQKFNINGQRVATGYRGLMIENGRKRMSR
jgi:hypothetical protein